MEITLKPITRHGMNRLESVRRSDPAWDGRWIVVDTRDAVTFARGERGPWHRVEPLCAGKERSYHARWIHGTRDKNFTMQPNARIEPGRCE